MGLYDDHLLVGSNHGTLTMGQLRKQLVTARAHSPAVGRMNQNCRDASQSESANFARSESVRDYWQSDRSADHREKVREALQANRKLSKGRDFKTIDERTARALMDIAIKSNVDALLADRMSLGQLRQRIDSFPDDIRDYVELATFNELARRWQAGQCPWAYR